MYLITTLSILLTLSSSSILFAGSDKKIKNTDCNDFFSMVIHEDYYRSLETSSPEREKWLKAKRFEFQDYHLKPENLKNREYWEEFYYSSYNKEKTVQSVEISEGKVELVDLGLKKPDQVILTNKKGEKEVLFSTFDLSKDGLFGMKYGSLSASPKKDMLVFSVLKDGSLDVADIFVYNLKQRKVINVIKNASAYKATWNTSKSFIYTKYASRDLITLEHKIDGHLNLLYEETPPKYYISSAASKIIGYQKSGATYLRAIDGKKEIKLDFNINSILKYQDDFLYVIKTNSFDQQELAKIRVLSSTTRSLQLGHAQSLEASDGVYRGAFIKENYIATTYSHGEKYWINFYNKNGDYIGKKDLPHYIEITGIEELEEAKKIKVSMQSRFVLSKEFEFDLATNKFIDPTFSAQMLTNKNGHEFISDVIYVKSKDDSMVPVKIVHKKGIVLDGNNPTLVEGYGGFGASGYFDPSFSYKNQKFLEDGGVYVAPILRGGSELGPQWREEATFEQKQNTFNDMIATLEGLIKKNYTNPDKIAIQGWSNGGLLVGALITQRPDLFKLAIPGNGVLDMLRKEVLDPRFDNGWSYEYGNSQDPEMFEVLQAYSPVHNTKEREYPTILIVVGNSDSRVNPAHSYKFAKALENAQTGESPILLLNVNNSGHWVTSHFEDIRSKVIAEIMATLYQELGMSPPTK